MDVAVYSTDSGSYRVLDQVGSPGGFASVYRVEGDDGAHYALKRLRLPGLPAKLLLDEAEHLRGIDHPNVIRYRDCGTRPHAFLVMELADAGTLRDLVAAQRARGGQLALHDVLRFSTQLLRALAAVHRTVVHCDVSAGNVLLRGDDSRLADFGSARGTQAAPGTVRTARSSRPPEGWLDGRSCRPGPAYDLYGAGVTMYELATSLLPFVGATEPDVRLQHLLMTPLAPRELRPELTAEVDDLILDLLRKDPARRPRSADEALLRLDEAAARAGHSE